MKVKQFAFIILFVVAFALWTAYIWSQMDDVHNFSGRCSGCHLTEPKKKGKLIFTRDISFLCTECHEEAKTLSHPVDIEPSMKVPNGFPLNWKREITCITCHVAHMAESKTGRSLMRNELKGEVFCRSCHNVAIEDLARHTTTLERAHVKKRSYTVKNRFDLIDDLSMKCLNCHDAALSSDTLIPVLGRGNYSHRASLGVSHPIGVDYFDVAVRRAMPYIKPENLDKRITLFNKKIGCGTCHNPYSNEHFQLVMSNEGSRLCFACHIK